jgi:hypothetical protein
MQKNTRKGLGILWGVMAMATLDQTNAASLTGAGVDTLRPMSKILKRPASPPPYALRDSHLGRGVHEGAEIK